MKKKYAIFLSALALLFSCVNDNELLETGTNNSNLEKNMMPRYGGDGKFDLLGHGCDVTNDFYLGKFRVVDNDKLIQIAPFAINTDETQSRKEEIIGNSTAESYLKSYTKNKGIGGGYGLGQASLQKIFTQSSSLSIENSFASVQKSIQKKSFSYTLDPGFIISQNCLSPEFIYALTNYTPEKIINMFGTHVYSNVKLGGTLNLIYRAKVVKTETEKIKTTEAGASAAFRSVFNANIKYSVTEQEKAIKETKDYSFVTVAKGGNVSIPLSSQEIKDINLVTVVDTGEWERSIGEQNAKGNVLIDFEPGSLIPLWEFVEDNTLKENLKNAIENYIEKNQYHDIMPDKVPLYQHYFNNGSVLDHLYSTSSKSPTYYSNQGIICYVYSSQVTGTVPVYHFYSSIFFNNYYSTNSSAPGAYSYKGPEFYVYPSQVEGTVPLYCYWMTNGKNFENHYYSTNPSTPNFYTKKGITGYVYPK